MTGRTCTRCGAFYTAEDVASGQAFRTQRGRQDASCLLKTFCRPCEETVTDMRKTKNRWVTKIWDTTNGHAEQLCGPRKGAHCDAWYDPDLTKQILVERYGWAQEQLAHDAEFQYGNGCSYCHHPYTEMGHGLADITLDIYDPRLPPDYSNTRWCCMTCQRRKGLLTPDKWAAKQRVYRTWETNRALSATARGMLF